MTVKELIEQLQELEQNEQIYYCFDGEARAKVNVIYLDKEENIVLASKEEAFYAWDITTLIVGDLES
jgi:mevalonate pyrophosphate decarboxylase